MEINSIHIQQYVDDPEGVKHELLLKSFVLSGREDSLELDRFPKIVKAVFVALCLKGSCELSINKHTYPIKKNDMCVCFSATVLQTLSKSPDFECMILATNARFIHQMDIPSAAELFLSIRENPCISLSKEEITFLHTYFRYINLAYERKGYPYRLEVTRQLLLALCYEVASIYQNGKCHIQHRYSYKDTLFRKFIQLLSVKYETERRTGFYAEMLHITPKYLSAIVKEVSHKSAAEWINDYVMQQAKLLLSTTSLTVQQISDKLHFANPSFFTQYFKRFTGKTPKEYRLSIQ